MIKLTTGHLGEDLACNYLTAKGYRITERNYHLGHLELDIVAAKNGETFLLEIKTRCQQQVKITENLISKTQITNLKKAAVRYAALHKIKFNLIHFDLILIVINRQKNSASLKHYRDIF